MGRTGHCGHRSCAVTVSISQIAVIGFCCCCSQLWAASSAQEISQLPLEDIVYDEVAKSFDGNVIHISTDLQIFINQIFLRLQCGNPDKPSECANCLKADDAFQFAGYLPGTEVLTPKTFLAVSLPILSYAVNLLNYCDGRNNSANIPCTLSTSIHINTTEQRLNCWIEQLTSNNDLTNDLVNGMLKNLSRFYVPRIFHNDSDIEDINATVLLYKTLNIPNGQSVTKEKLPIFAALLLKKLFYGHPVLYSESLTASTPIVIPISTITSRSDISESTVSTMIPGKFMDFLLDIGPGNQMSIDRLDKIMKHLKIGTSTTLLSEHESENSTEHHHAIAKRAANSSTNPLESCWSQQSLLHFYQMERDTLTKTDFERLCPALIQQSFSGVCVTPTSTETSLSTITEAEKYGYGTLSVIVISLLSIIGIVFLPLLKKKIYTYALQGFIALGVGTLCGDGLLHLLPEALNVHAEHEHAGEEKKDLSDNLVLWRSVGCLAAIYVFFLWEICLHYFIEHRKRGSSDISHDHDHEHKHSHIPDPETFKSKMKTASTVSAIELQVSKSDVSVPCSDETHEPQEELFLGLRPLAWMILLGDAIHNFGDGMTIASAFSSDLRSGLSTSIAIFCHEIPHELGDFAILLSTGMSFKKALLLNFISAITCLIGFYVGIPVATNTAARQWIFTVAAGMFLYVALGDMLPELKNGATNLRIIFLQNLGLIIGFAIMILMALFEDSIQI